MKKHIVTLLAINLILAIGAFGQTVKPAGGGQETLDARLNGLAKQISDELTENQKQRVAVVEFVDLKGNISDFGRYLAEELITRLYQTKKFKVVERQLLNKIVAEQKLSLTGIIEPTSAQKLGKLLGVDAICSGSISDLGKILKVNARLINTETGEVFSVAAAEILKDESVCALGGCGSSNNPQTNSENSAGKTRQDTVKPIRAVSNNFTFDLKRCMRKNTSVICEFTVINNDTDREFIIHSGDYTLIRVFDDSNNEYRATSVQLANRAKRGWDTITLPTDIPANISIIFDGVDEKAVKFTLVQVVGSTGSEFDVKFRDVPITK